MQELGLFEYHKFTEQCDKYGYTYEPFTVRTADAWHLTLFHITGYKGWGSDKKQDERDQLTDDKYPILSIPGSFSDA